MVVIQSESITFFECEFDKLLFHFSQQKKINKTKTQKQTIS